MTDQTRYQIITFYEFKYLGTGSALTLLRITLRDAMKHHSLKGTIILAAEGYNSTICGQPNDIDAFVAEAEQIFGSKLRYKSSFHDAMPFRRIDVKVKPEIVTLKKPVDVSLGSGTHVKPAEWNAVISDPEVFVLDTRNDYEFRNGSFRNATNPKTDKFSELPDFVAENLDPNKHKKVAMFCTGGIRCEKFAPYLVNLGFENVYQLEGGILKYLEEVPAEKSLWEGECFVFDDRRTVDEKLEKGVGPDYSQEVKPKLP
jgi:UPF0176 protein